MNPVEFAIRARLDELDAERDPRNSDAPFAAVRVVVDACSGRDPLAAGGVAWVRTDVLLALVADRLGVRA